MKAKSFKEYLELRLTAEEIIEIEEEAKKIIEDLQLKLIRSLHAIPF